MRSVAFCKEMKCFLCLQWYTTRHGLNLSERAANARFQARSRVIVLDRR